PQRAAMQSLGAYVPLGLIAWLHGNSDPGGSGGGAPGSGGAEPGASGFGGIKSPAPGFVDVAQVAAYAARHSAQEALDNLERFPAPADADYARFAPGDNHQPMVAVYRRGTLAVAIQTLTADGTRTSVAVVLDDAHLGIDHQESWREWLHLSNLMGWRIDPTVITVTSAVDLPAAKAPAPAFAPDPTPAAAAASDGLSPVGTGSAGTSPDGVSPEWQDLLDDALDDERPFLEQLLAKHAGIPLPELGEEHGSHNVPAVFSWPGERIAVVAEEQDLTALETDGWQVFLLSDAGAVANVGEALGGG
ncbi:MAG TPA: hypothetical protein VK054_10500, partial [Beutenbergiaceae bacterium]|nr:hypothetical protein [Beutenbergiaceae bacterium]